MDVHGGKDAATEEMPKEDILHESDEFYTKWSGPMIIGAFVPAVFAVITVVGGAITLGSWEGQCGYPLQSKSTYDDVTVAQKSLF